MSAKRPFSELDPAETEDGPPTRGRPDETGSWKKRKQNGTSKHKAAEGSMEWTKKRARTIERLFQRDQDLPADVRNELERELAAHKTSIVDKEIHKKRSNMISKYHMVRFFERKKASRLAKQLRRKIEQNSASDDIEDLKRQLHVSEVDEAYSINFPHMEPYISLYSKVKSGKADETEEKTPIAKAALAAERPPMWKTVERAMEEGPEALRRLRERKEVDDLTTEKKLGREPRKASAAKPHAEQKPPPRPAPANKQPSRDRQTGKEPTNRRERRRIMHESLPPTNGIDDDEEGGFFEEAG